MINILFWVVFGAVAGWVVTIATGLPNVQAAARNAAAGITGAVGGGLISGVVTGRDALSRFSVSNLVIAVLCALVLLMGLSTISRNGQ